MFISDFTISSSTEMDSDGPVCAICLDALDRKRIVTLTQCKHQFHRTCALGWFESNQNPSTHSCCLCRASVTTITGGNGSRICRMFPFEEAEAYMKNLLLLGVYEANYDNVDILNEGREQVVGELRKLESEKELAKKVGKCEEYIIDIDEERTKLEKRKCAIDMLLAYHEGITAAISSGHVHLRNLGVRSQN